MDVVTVEFDQTVDDVVDFQRHHVRNNRYRWFLLVPTAMAIVAALGLAALAVMFHFMGENVPALITGIAAGASLVMSAGVVLFQWFLAPYLSAHLALMNAGQRTMLIGPRAVAVSADGIGWRYPSGESSVLWTAVDRIEPAPEAIYVYFGSRSAIWLPRRAFGSDAEYGRVVELMQDYLSQLKRGSGYTEEWRRSQRET